MGVEPAGLLNWGGASTVAAVAVARWRPTAGTGRVRRKPIDLDLVHESRDLDEMATDGERTGDDPMSMTADTMNGRGTPGAGATPPTGLPPEQLYTWLEWVQDDLRRIEARLEYLEAARAQLADQERLLNELLHSSGPLARR
jgi:hypothetical protein